MFKRTPKEVPQKLEETAISILASMKAYTPDSAEFKDLLNYLERIEAIRTPERRSRLNPNNIALVVGNLLGIVVIVAYEQKHVFVSKAQGFVLKSSK